MVGVRHDGSQTKRLSYLMGSPPEADWWPEFMKQVNAHRIRHYWREDRTWDREAEEQDWGDQFQCQYQTFWHWLREIIRRFDPRP